MEIQIIAGFTDAGKTTFLNQYIPTLSGKTIVLQNEFGEVKLDAKTSEEVALEQITEGCICCTVSLAFRQCIEEIAEKYHPDRILIEPSGIGYLRDVVKACVRAKEECEESISITKLITIVDLSCLEECLEGLGLVFQEQIQNASLLLMSHMDETAEEERETLFGILRELNPGAVICEKDFSRLKPEELGEILTQVEECEEIENVLLPIRGSISRKNSKNENKISYIVSRKQE